MSQITNIGKKLYSAIFFQLTLTLILAIAFKIYSNSFISAFCGGIICTLPAFIFIKLFFSCSNSYKLQQKSSKNVKIAHNFSADIIDTQYNNQNNHESHDTQLYAKKILNKFYLAEIVKFFITFLLFSLVISFIKIDPIAFFMTFILVQMTNWVLGFRNLVGALI